MEKGPNALKKSWVSPQVEQLEVAETQGGLVKKTQESFVQVLGPPVNATVWGTLPG